MNVWINLLPLFYGQIRIALRFPSQPLREYYTIFLLKSQLISVYFFKYFLKNFRADRLFF